MTNLVDTEQDQLDAKDRYLERREVARWDRLDREYDAREAAAFERNLDEVFGLDGA